jgi:hypothetical protein
MTVMPPSVSHLGRKPDAAVKFNPSTIDAGILAIMRTAAAAAKQQQCNTCCQACRCNLLTQAGAVLPEPDL